MLLDMPKIKTENVRLDDFTVNHDEGDNIQLGKGSFADVYKALHKI